MIYKNRIPKTGERKNRGARKARLPAGSRPAAVPMITNEPTTINGYCRITAQPIAGRRGGDA